MQDYLDVPEFAYLNGSVVIPMLYSLYLEGASIFCLFYMFWSVLLLSSRGLSCALDCPLLRSSIIFAAHMK